MPRCEPRSRRAGSLYAANRREATRGTEQNLCHTRWNESVSQSSFSDLEGLATALVEWSRAQLDFRDEETVPSLSHKSRPFAALTTINHATREAFYMANCDLSRSRIGDLCLYHRALTSIGFQYVPC